MRTFIYIVTFLFVVFIGGVITGKLYQKIQVGWQTTLYTTTNQSLIDNFSRSQTYRLSWEELIPESEKALLKRYQLPTSEDVSEQIFLALQANYDDEYRSALISTNVAEETIGRSVAISGFIVPLEVHEDRSIKSFFLVPYYGACIHYPPPPPNQIIYVQLEGSFTHHNMQTAFTVEGILNKGIFEDPMGTSAYLLDAVNITSFSGQPDDFRQHN